MLKLWIKDKCTGRVREYGSNHHDCLIVDRYGRIKYYNLQNGGGTGFGADSEYEFVPDPEDEFLREIFSVDGTIDMGGYHTDAELRKMRISQKKMDKMLCKSMRKDHVLGVFTRCKRPTCIGCRRHITTID